MTTGNADPSAASRQPDDLLRTARTILASQPFSEMLGTEIVSCDASGVAIQLSLTPNLCESNGFAHGGVLAYLADVSISFAAGLAVGPPILTAEIKINYLRPAVGDKLIARATALGAGRNQGVARCDIYAVAEGAEKLCATGLGSVMKASSTPT